MVYHAYSDCPPVATITPSVGPFLVGDVLNCTSDCSASSYSFTDSSGTVTAGNTVTLSEGWFNFTCTVIIDNHVPCSASVSVAGTAIGKNYIGLMCTNPSIGGGLAQLVATLIGSTKLLYAGPG